MIRSVYEDKILQKVLKQLDGMTKIEVFDIFHKIEILLQGQPSPIQYDRLKLEMDKRLLNNSILPIGNNGLCYLVDFTDHLNIYEFKSMFPFDFWNKTLYYSAGDKQNILPFTNENIKTTFENTNLKYIIQQFLEENHVKKRNSKTKRLLLMELLDMVDEF